MKTIKPTMQESGPALLCLAGLAAFALSANSLFAAELTEAQVLVAVQTWVRHMPADARPDAVVEKMEPVTSGGRPIAYVAHLAGGGFCIAGADDALLVVYLYSTAGRYNPKVEAFLDVFAEIRASFANQSKMKAQGGANAVKVEEELARRKAEWQTLSSGVVLARSPTERGLRTTPELIELPLTARWRQEFPYNELCPALTPSGTIHSKAGCVAVAMAQVMHYWKWPNTGTGTSTDGWQPLKYAADWVEEPCASDPQIPSDWASDLGQGQILTWTSTRGGKLRMKGYWDISMVDSAHNGMGNFTAAYNLALHALFESRLTDLTRHFFVNFAATTYNWSIMGSGDPAGGYPPDPVSDPEVAKLVYHCGLAAGLRYGVWGTSGDTGRSMVDHFKYDADYIRHGTDASFPAEVVGEIQWMRPVFIVRGGHAWIFYGYDQTVTPWLFLANVGWGYNDHVWRTIDADFGGDGVIDIYIAPQTVVEFVGSASSGDGSPSDPYQTIGAAITSAGAGTTLIFKAGTTHTMPTHPYTISKHLKLNGHDVLIE